MGFRPALISLILAIAAVAAAVYVNRLDPEAARLAAIVRQPLVTPEQLPLEPVRRITLTRRGEQPLVFERHELRWMQIEPFSFPMDSYSMRQLVAVAHNVQVVQRLGQQDLDDTLSAQSLGLNPPEATIHYEWDGGSLKLALGRRGIAGRAYLQKNDEQEVLVVRQDLHERAIEMDPREWRDRTIFQNVGVESHRIVRSDGLQLQRERRQWLMSAPVETRADAELVEQFLQQLGGAQSGGFIADQPRDLHRFGLQPSAASIIVHSGQSEQQRLDIGMPVGAGTQDRFGIVQGRPSVVRIPAAVLQAFFRQPSTLIDLTGSGQVAADVRSLRIRTTEGEIVLQRDMERWRAPEHGNAEVPASYVDDLLAHLTELRAGSVRIQEYPQELEVAMVTFFGFRGQPLDTVRIVHDPNSGAWALENGDNVLRVFERGFAPRLTLADFGLAPTINE